MTAPAQSLSASADIAETVGKHMLARFWRDMAESCSEMEGVKPGMGSALYRDWAKQAAAKASTFGEMGR